MLLIFILFGINMLNAQDSLSNKRVNPQFWISVYSNPNLDSNSTKIVCRLYEVKDSSIVISKSSKLSDYYAGKFEVAQFNFNQIRKYFISYVIFIPTVITSAVGANKIDKQMFVVQRFSNCAGWYFAGYSYYF